MLGKKVNTRNYAEKVRRFFGGKKIKLISAKTLCFVLNQIANMGIKFKK